MDKSALFLSDDKKATIRAWFDTFQAKSPVPTESRSVETSFGQTHALVAGPQDAPPLVVLHGAIASSAHALPELGPLLQTRRIYALDVIGQSVMSEDRRLELSDDSYGQWLVEATSALGLESFDLYGVSWGGFVGHKAARFAPERVTRLVLLVPAGFVAGNVWAGMRDAAWPMLRFRLFPSSKNLASVVKGQFTTIDADWTAYFGDALRCYRFAMRMPPLAKDGDFSSVKCPVLVFGAENDLSFPGAPLLKRVCELMPHAEVELLKGSKHCPPFTDEFRSQMAARIERFLRDN